jgi:hypothetical protein
MVLFLHMTKDTENFAKIRMHHLTRKDYFTPSLSYILNIYQVM